MPSSGTLRNNGDRVLKMHSIYIYLQMLQNKENECEYVEGNWHFNGLVFSILP